jgi:hypothetical protein
MTDLVCFQSEQGCIAIKPVPGQIVADVYHGHGDDTADQLAHKMAAAQDLLDALVRAEKLVETLHSLVGLRDTQATRIVWRDLQMIRAAIAKARGDTK